MIKYIVVLLVCGLFPLVVNSATIQFTATDFSDISGGGLITPPEKTVSGIFGYELDALGFFSLTTFDMIISNKVYTLSDMFVDQVNNTNLVLIGDNGAANHQDPNNGTNDFWFSFSFPSESALNVSNMIYTVAEDNGNWKAATHTTTISEPVSFSLLLLGIAVIGFSRNNADIFQIKNNRVRVS